jgi:hypothetical protein
MGDVPESEDFRMAGNTEVTLYYNSSSIIDLDP